MMAPYFIKFKAEILLQLLCFRSPPTSGLATQLRDLSNENTATQASLDSKAKLST
jgi:hypothetical protein